MKAKALTDTEIAAILAQLGSARNRCLFILGLRTGFRISELLSLTWNDVLQYGDIKPSISVTRRNMKGKIASRSVVLHDQAKEALCRYLIDFGGEPKARLFPISRIQAHRIIRAACTRAGIAGAVSTHSMRKTFGQGVYQRTGKDIVATQRALGHRNLSSTQHYLEVDQEAIDKAILGA